MTELTGQAGTRSDVVPTRLPTLTGMRFIAAAMVFLHHTTFANLFSSADDFGTFRAIVAQGNSGVSFFFILSGFVLAWSRRPTDTAPRFWRRRLFKIYPNHLLVFVVSVLLIAYGVTTFGVSPVEFWPAVLNATLVQAWPHDLGIAFSVNLVTWSLACEVFFYFCFPWLARAIDRIRPERLWAAALTVVALIVAVPFLARLLPAEPPVPQVGLTTWELWFIQVFPPVRMLEFVLGILLARIVLAGRRLPLDLGGAVALAIGAYALSSFFPPAFRLAAIMALPLALVIAAGAVSDTRRQGSWLSSGPLVWLGDVSFAFYLWHYMVIMTVRSQLDSLTGWSTPAAVALIVGLFAITLVLSWLLYSTVERPVMSRFATSRRHRPAERPSAPVSPAGPQPADPPTTLAQPR